MRILSLLLFSVFLTSLSFAQNWTGNVSSDWNNAANWSTWPLNGADITIDPASYTGVAASPMIGTNSSFSPAAVLVQNGGVLTISANLTTQDDVECIGNGSMIVQNSGTFAVNPGGGGRLIIDLGASMLLNFGTVNVDERFIAGEDALITINNGTASSGERLLMDLGGQFVQNGGTVNVAATFAMADGSLLNNSGYTLNGGTLNVTGEFAMECEAGNFQPFFTQNAGTLNVNGDIFWLGSAPGSGQGRFTMNGGSATVSGLVQNMPLSTMNMYLSLRNAASLTLNGNLLEGYLPGDSLLQSGFSSLIFNAAGTFNNPGVLLATGGTAFVNANLALNGTGSYQWHNLTLNAPGTLQVLTANDQNLSGNLVHNGSYQANITLLRLNGTQAQTLSGTTSILLHHLTLEHSGPGVTLSTPLTMSGDLVLNNGILFTNSGDSFVLGANSTSTPGNATAYVDGPMTKNGSAAFVFPVGKNSRWARIGKSATSNVTDSYRAEYFNSSYTSITPVNAPLTAVSNLEYWNLEALSGVDPVIVSLYWEDAASSAIVDCNDITIAQWNGTSWDNHFSSTTGSCTGNGSGNLESISAISNPGIVTIGFLSGVTSQNVTICAGEQLIVGTSTYQNSGTYIDYLQDVNMNDSIVITILTVNDPNPTIQLNGIALEAVNQNATAYNWLDCANNYAPIGVNANTFTPSASGEFALAVSAGNCADTSACLYYTLLNEQICQGESFAMGSGTYSTAGTYSEMLTSVSGSDSIVVLNLSVQAVDLTVNMNGITLSSPNANATAFQWINCATSSAITGATGSSFTPTQNGTYAVIVTENGCADTSACMTISTIGLAEWQANNFQLFPNPSQGEVTLSWSDLAPDHVGIYGADGQRVHYLTPEAGSPQMLLNLGAGYYFVSIETKEAVYRMPLIIVETK